MLDAPLDLGMAATLASDFFTNVLSSVVAITSNQFTYDTIAVHDLLRPEVISQDFPILTGGVGTITSPVSDATTAPVVTSESGKAGRSYRGRLYLPGIPKDSVEDDTVDTDLLAGMNAIATLLLAVQDRLRPWLWAIPSYKHGLVTAVLSWIARAIVGGQSRRRKGKGI
jgi:hypothetical protein